MPALEPALRLSELIDLELRFAADRGVDRQVLRDRDDRLGREILTEDIRGSRHVVFRRWLQALRRDDSATPGERAETGYRLLGVVLGLGALLLGGGTARTVLAYDGTHPVNVVHFLAVFVVAQLALVALALVAMLPLLRPGRMRSLSPLQELLRQINYRRGPRDGRGRTRADASATLGRLSAVGGIYGKVERWALVILTQRTAFFFNVGALFACLYLIAFTDLAFAWSTTLDFDSDRMLGLLRALSLPWSWLGAAVPSAELVEASRYFRKSGSYDPTALKDWWAFLLAALSTYGVAPRLLLWMAATWRERAARAAVRFDHGDAQTAYERLTRSLHGWRGAGHDAESGDREARMSPSKPVTATLPRRTSDVVCTAIRWADIPLTEEESERLIVDRFGWRATAVYACGGRDGVEERRRMMTALAHDAVERPVVVLAEAWEAPSRAVTGFLSEIRGGVDARKPLVVALLGDVDGAWGPPAVEDLDVWERATAALGDPYLRVEPVVGE